MFRAVMVLALVGGVAGVAAQAPDLSAPRFEVASVKPANPLTPNASSRSEGAGWRASNVTLFTLVQLAFPEFSYPQGVVGGPPWIHEARFDVRARAASVPAAEALNAMVRNLLADRFSLRTHVERRLLDVYVARLVDGTPRQGLVPSAPDCSSARREGRALPDSCASMRRARAADGRALTLIAVTMPMLFRVFGFRGVLDRPVVDRTGLNGYYDAFLHYQSADPLNAPAGGTTLLAAAEDQLGLKFERSRENLDVLVIDSVEMPTPD